MKKKQIRFPSSPIYVSIMRSVLSNNTQITFYVIFHVLMATTFQRTQKKKYLYYKSDKEFKQFDLRHTLCLEHVKYSACYVTKRCERFEELINECVLS